MKAQTLVIEGLTFQIFFHDELEYQQMNEAKSRGRHLTGTFEYDIHKPHNSTGEYHIHLRDKGKEILSMNKVSGTAHDGYHGVRIPNKAFKALQQKLPDWNWPKNQIIESKEYTYFMLDVSRSGLRPVKVFPHKNPDREQIDGFVGFFHQFAADPFLTGGNGGWKERTIAIIETEDGYVRKVSVDQFKFMDTDKPTMLHS
ncbi:MAG TPA: hypothetical protein VFE50_22185 [Cyclobacteriaceae bacterium]|nr:hypothetical protein [Cyclobacteriaceae bacterium]